MVTLAEPIEADALRLRHHFLEMPGLLLTPTQAARLVGVTLAHATAMLNTLAHEGFLERAVDSLDPVAFRRPKS